MQNILPEQEILLKKLQEIDPKLSFEWDEVRGVASYVRGELVPGSDNPRGEARLENLVKKFLAEFGGLFGPVDLNKKLRILRKRKDDLSWNHLEFQQLHFSDNNRDRQRKPLEVYGSKLAAHLRPDGTLTDVQSSCWREIKLETEATILIKDLHQILTRFVVNTPGFRELQVQMQKQKEKNFPMMQEPRLVIYNWHGGFRLSWTTYSYGPVEVEDNKHNVTGANRVDLGQVFVDAHTGEIFLFAPMSRDVDNPDSGSGLGVTPLTGTFVSRSLNIIRVDTSSTYRLRDTTLARDIITYDADNSANFDTDDERRDGLNNGTISISTDDDGNKNWSRVPSNTTVSERTASQQPEVDLHHYIRQAYEWYNALGGTRAGWDDGQYPNPPVPPQTIRSIAHARDGTNSSSINAGERLRLVSGNWLCWLQFFDGDRTTYDYLAGSKFIAGHEYQHAITEFNFEDAAGNPGLTYSGWLSAVHEGLSDVFGGLFSEQWLTATEISPIGQIFRNIAFPRDDGPPPSTAAWDANKNDHFDDRNSNPGRYERGTILAHCAYLTGQGGVHQRASRSPILIPVYGLGRQTVGGIDLLKAARIWYRATTYYFSTHGALTGIPSSDENTFRTIRNGCVSAAIDYYGTGSLEHRSTVLAFYAVGLHPTTEQYGADVTMLRWGVDWWMSSSYIGLSSPFWSSLDLFINNGGISEWNALINVIDSAGNPTQFENNVYCRIRNVGDRDARNVQVQFSYAKCGSGITTWLPMTDKNGNIQTLNLGTLGAGQSNFADSAQNSPPANASVKWYIPPLAQGETVDHFCIKANVTSIDDVNIYNNEVQSNVAYVPYTPSGSFTMSFMVGNPMREKIPVELQIRTQLPKGWKTRILGAEEKVMLKPGEERPLDVIIDMASGADKYFELPLDGEIKGDFFGSISSPFYGVLTETTWDKKRLQGRLSANLDEIGSIVGGFDGVLNPLTGEIKGRLTGAFQCTGMNHSETLCVGIRGCLRPWRRIDISQIIKGRAIGGITLQVQVPNSMGPCSEDLPPTDTNVILGRPVAP